MTDRGIAPGHNYLWDLATAEASSLRKWKEGRVPRSLVVLLPLSSDFIDAWIGSCPEKGSG